MSGLYTPMPWKLSILGTMVVYWNTNNLFFFGLAIFLVVAAPLREKKKT